MNNYHLDQAIENLRMFSQDNNGTNNMPDSNNIYIYNYQNSSNTAEPGWRPMNGATLTDALYIIMDRVDYLASENDTLRNQVDELTNKVEELEQIAGENELGLTA